MSNKEEYNQHEDQNYISIDSAVLVCIGSQYHVEEKVPHKDGLEGSATLAHRGYSFMLSCQ